MSFVHAIDIAQARLQTEEGFRPTLYKDTQGHQTLGFGFNVDAGISKGCASALLQAQLNEIDAALTGFSWYASADPVRQSVFLDIALNDGVHGLLKFPHLLAAAARGDWPAAAIECHVKEPELASRYAALAKLLLTGAST
jgi:GH24 family phage-related lysozyme (muramidase)